MAALWTVKRGDTCPPLAIELFDDYGNALPEPLSVTCTMFRLGFVVDTGPADILEVGDYRLWVQYVTTALTMNTTGEYLVEWEVNYKNNNSFRAPTDGYDVVRVLAAGS